jgi:hypothetical protein
VLWFRPFGLADQFAVGVVTEAVGLVGALGPGGHAVQIVDAAGGGPGDGAGAVAHLLADPVAHRVERVAARFAAVVAPADEAMGSVVRIAQHQAAGQPERFHQARGGVGERGGRLAAYGLGQQAVAKIPGIGSEQAVGGRLADDAVGRVVAVPGGMAQGIGGLHQVAHGVVLEGGDRTIGRSLGGHLALHRVAPLPALGLAVGGVGHRARQGIAPLVIGPGGDAPGLGDQQRQAEARVPLGGGALLRCSAGGMDDGQGQAACGIPGGVAADPLEVGLAGDEAVGILHARGGIGLAGGRRQRAAGDRELAEGGVVRVGAADAEGIGDGGGAGCRIADLVSIDAAGALAADGAALGIVGIGGEAHAAFVDDAGQGLGKGGVLIEIATGFAVGIAHLRESGRGIVGVADGAAIGGGERAQQAGAVVGQGERAAEGVGDGDELAGCVIGVAGDPAIARSVCEQLAGGVELRGRIVIGAAVDPGGGCPGERVGAVGGAPKRRPCGLRKGANVAFGAGDRHCRGMGAGRGVQAGAVRMSPGGAEGAGRPRCVGTPGAAVEAAE